MEGVRSALVPSRRKTRGSSSARSANGAREGYDRLKAQDLAPEVLNTLCSWLGATLR